MNNPPGFYLIGPIYPARIGPFLPTNVDPFFPTLTTVPTETEVPWHRRSGNP